MVRKKNSTEVVRMRYRADFKSKVCQSMCCRYAADLFLIFLIDFKGKVKICNKSTGVVDFAANLHTERLQIFRCEKTATFLSRVKAP